MERDEAFVEYALHALLRDVQEFENLIPLVAMSNEELKTILKVQERLRPERIAALRELCSDEGIGYATIDKSHYFFLNDGIGARLFQGDELAQFVKTVDDFESVYGSKKADELYESRTYSGIHTGSKNRKKRSSR